MRALRLFAVRVVLVVGALYVAYNIAYPTYTHRFRMTVEVVVDGQIISGSSVIQVDLIRQPKILPEVPPLRAETKGDAVFVDLGQGRNLVAVLGSKRDGTDYPVYVVMRHFKLSGNDLDLPKYPGLEGRWDLPRDQLPILATFMDIKNPITSRALEPDSFETILGKEPVPEICAGR